MIAVLQLDARPENESQPFSRTVDYTRWWSGGRGRSSRKTPASTGRACFHPLELPNPDHRCRLSWRDCIARDYSIASTAANARNLKIPERVRTLDVSGVLPLANLCPVLSLVVLNLGVLNLDFPNLYCARREFRRFLWNEPTGTPTVRRWSCPTSATQSSDPH